MSVSLLPKAIYPALTSVSLQELSRKGIRLLMLDFDNTIIPYTTNAPMEDMRQWLTAALNSQVQICVVSNSKRDRVVRFCQKYAVPCVTHAKKPSSKGIRTAMERFGQKPEHCALAGDQIYTDVLGANLAGVYSILVPAINNHNIWLKLRHALELPWIFCARKRSVKS